MITFDASKLRMTEDVGFTTPLRLSSLPLRPFLPLLPFCFLY